MTAQTGNLKVAGYPIAVLALTVCAFAIGTAEFVIAGLLPDIARDLAVTIPAAGQLVTAYAIGVVIGAPLLAIGTARMARKSVLLLMLAIFIAGNLASALSPNYSSLMASRVLAALAHGSLFGVGVVVVSGLVPENRRASALALMFSGLTLAHLAGVPLGTFIGQLGGWRATFFVITGLGVLSLGVVWQLIPSVMGDSGIHLGNEFAVARSPKVLLALLTTVLSCACVFTLFTYVIPILRDVAGLSASASTAALFVSGLGFTIGINIGGRLSDRDSSKALVQILVALSTISFVFAAVCGSGLGAIITLFFWATAAFAIVSPLQSRVISAAKQAPNLSSSLNIGAFNLGNALGAFLGGAVLDLGFGLRAPAIAAGLLALVGLCVATVSSAVERP